MNDCTPKTLYLERIFGHELTPGLQWNSYTQTTAKDAEKMVGACTIPESIQLLQSCAIFTRVSKTKNKVFLPYLDRRWPVLTIQP